MAQYGLLGACQLYYNYKNAIHHQFKCFEAKIGDQEHSKMIFKSHRKHISTFGL